MSSHSFFTAHTFQGFYENKNVLFSCWKIQKSHGIILALQVKIPFGAEQNEADELMHFLD